MVDSEKPSLGIVGGGRAAWAIGSVWRATGWPLAGISLREGSPSPIAGMLNVRPAPPEELARDADVLVLAVSDRAIEAVAETIRDRISPDKPVFHMSGSLPSSILGSPRAFSLHPFRALPPVGETVHLAGALLVYEGADESFELAGTFAASAGARLARIDAAQKALYHAAAVLAANDVAALLDLAETMLHEIGLEGLDADVAALADTAIVNWLTAEGTARFTGPVVRGDIEVLRRHHQALSADPHRARLYASLAMEIVAALARRGSSEFEAHALAQRVRDALDLP